MEGVFNSVDWCIELEKKVELSPAAFALSLQFIRHIHWVQPCRLTPNLTGKEVPLQKVFLFGFLCETQENLAEGKANKRNKENNENRARERIESS